MLTLREPTRLRVGSPLLTVLLTGLDVGAALLRVLLYFKA
ncbi:biotin carboxylase [Paenarthrobacter sp. A20]|nr:biotin carboxylase [Paenarthrobacter sp. A20]